MITFQSIYQHYPTSIAAYIIAPMQLIACPAPLLGPFEAILTMFRDPRPPLSRIKDIGFEI